MALGIIVDDAVVVSEDALTRHRAGAGALEAAEKGARRMLVPVLASSFTTIAGFLPMMLVSGPTGRIIFDVPLVVICVVPRLSGRLLPDSAGSSAPRIPAPRVA